MDDEVAMRIDLDGQIFDIGQDIIDKYPECVLAQSMMVSDGAEPELIEIDRDGKYFSRILEYSRGNRRAFNLSRMSRMEIKKLVNDLNYFGIADDLSKQCQQELTIKNQRCIETATCEEEFNDMIAGETRIVIILNLRLLVSNSNEEPGGKIEKALKLVDRDKCLIVGYSGKLEGFLNQVSEEQERSDYSMDGLDAILCDPVTRNILITYQFKWVCEEDLLQMIYYANTLHSCALLTKTFTEDLVKDQEQKSDVGTIFLNIRRLDLL